MKVDDSKNDDCLLFQIRKKDLCRYISSLNITCLVREITHLFCWKIVVHGVWKFVTLCIKANHWKSFVNSSIWIRALQYIRGSLSIDQAKFVVCAIIGSRLDYCNWLLVGTSAKNITRLQHVQNSAVMVVRGCENTITSDTGHEKTPLAPGQSPHHFKSCNDNFQSSKLIWTEIFEWTLEQISTDQISSFLGSKFVVGAALQNS